jgi:hypothetical protein
MVNPVDYDSSSPGGIFKGVSRGVGCSSFKENTVLDWKPRGIPYKLRAASPHSIIAKCQESFSFIPFVGRI